MPRLRPGSWITVQTVIYVWIKVQTVISTLIEIEDYDSPHEEAAPNPNGPGYTPGITSAGVPGETPPELRGLPVPLPPADLPGPPPPRGPGPQVPDYPPPGVPVPVEIGGH